MKQQEKETLRIGLSILVLTLTTYSLIYVEYCCLQCHSITDSRSDIITISGILSAILITYLVSKVLQIRSEKISKQTELFELTQKVHKFRTIISIILNSNLWANGIRNFVEVTFKGLTYYDIRQVSIVRSQSSNQAQNFIKQKKSDTASLFLELKSFNSNSIFDRKLHSEFDVNEYYETEMLKNWVEYGCGTGLWRFFTDQWSVYSSDFHFDNVYIGDKEKIEKFSSLIDKERYLNHAFGPDLLSQLGVQFTEDILPRLARLQHFIEKGLPLIVKYLFSILILLVIFGVTLPFIVKVYGLPPIFDIISASFLLTVCFYFIISFYDFLCEEIRL